MDFFLSNDDYRFCYGYACAVGVLAIGIPKIGFLSPSKRRKTIRQRNRHSKIYQKKLIYCLKSSSYETNKLMYMFLDNRRTKGNDKIKTVIIDINVIFKLA